jgi:beta-lactamase class D/beta-lactamase regulating signal transducer with metallopeptidase domain
MSAMTAAAVALLGRASLLLGAALGLALVLAWPGLRLRPAARHALVLGALLAGALAPLWLTLAGALAAPVPVRGLGPAGVTAPDPVAASAPPAVEAAYARVERGWEHRPGWVIPTLFWLWGGGVVLGLARVAHGMECARRLRRRARPCAEPALLAALARAGEGSGVPLLLSGEVASAIVTGVRRPAIVIGDPVARLPAPALEAILTHELGHARRRDPLWGLLQRLVASLYWFHPVVHLASRVIARTREEACDDDVRAAHDPRGYALTLLALASGTPPVASDLLAVGHARGGIEARIRRIVSPGAAVTGIRGAALLAAMAAGILALGARLAFALAPVAATGPGPGTAAPGEAIAAVDAATARADAALFRAVSPAAEGAFVLRDLRRGHTTAFNPAFARTRVMPASTFKIVIALLALDTGVARDEHFALAWDGRPGLMSEWNQDMDLATAMRLSANWFFIELHQRLDPRAVPRALRALRYGNQQLAADPVQSWLDGPLAISAVEQVDFLGRLATGDVPYGARAREALARTMQLDARAGAVLYGKSGTLFVDGGVIAWLVGHGTWGDERFAYATVMRAPAADADRLREQRLELTRALLVQRGAFPPGP